jgi:hypothetical protein
LVSVVNIDQHNHEVVNVVEELKDKHVAKLWQKTFEDRYRAFDCEAVVCKVIQIQLLLCSHID